jgi:hypothetical protein
MMLSKERKGEIPYPIRYYVLAPSLRPANLEKIPQ